MSDNKRQVEIIYEPTDDFPYVSVDSDTRNVLRRHSDSRTLRLECEKRGWEVVRPGAR